MNKNRKIFCYQTANLLQVSFLLLVSMKGQQEDITKFVTRYFRVVGIFIFI